MVRELYTAQEGKTLTVTRKSFSAICTQVSTARKILIVGPCGAGKSTLAQKISAYYQIPVIHLDMLYYQPNWQHCSIEEFIAQQEKIFRSYQQWIIDGNYQSTIDVRLQQAQLIIVCDPPPLLCLVRIIRRKMRFYGQSQPYNCYGCEERFDKKTLQLLRYSLWYRHTMLPKLCKKIAQYPQLKLIRVN